MLLQQHCKWWHLFRSFSYSLSLEWFILFLQLLVIIAIPALSLMGKIQQVKLFMIHMLAILSTLWLTFANRVCILLVGPAACDDTWNMCYMRRYRDRLQHYA